MTTSITGPPVVLTASQIDELPSTPLGDDPAVTHRVLWQDGESMAGVLTLAAGSRLGQHAHRVNHHHLWVLAGSALILGTEVGPGGYVHVPARVDHDIDATSTEGCTVFYLYLRGADRAGP